LPRSAARRRGSPRSRRIRRGRRDDLARGDLQETRTDAGKAGKRLATASSTTPAMQRAVAPIPGYGGLATRRRFMSIASNIVLAAVAIQSVAKATLSGLAIKGVGLAMLGAGLVGASRGWRDFEKVAAMDQRELRDIGLTPGDIASAGAMPRRGDPTLALAEMVEGRRSSHPRGRCRDFRWRTACGGACRRRPLPAAGATGARR